MPEHDGIPVDPPDEILANKLTAVVGRAEERDLIGVGALPVTTAGRIAPGDPVARAPVT